MAKGILLSKHGRINEATPLLLR